MRSAGAACRDTGRGALKAISFAAPIPRYLTTLAAGKLSSALYMGPHACTRYGDVASPTLPSDRWVRVRTRLGGICGSDLAIVTLASSPATSPFSSFPFVLGHESVGDVVEIGSGVKSVKVGDRVATNPLLCCEARGISPVCGACREGQHQHCTHFTDGSLAPGMLVGTTRGTGGSWGEEFVAHDSQLLPLPTHVSDEEAVLVEPFACSVHAVRLDPPRNGERVLVIGAGSIGLLTTAAIHAIVPSAQITVLARHDFQAAQAQRLGATRVMRTRGSYLQELADVAQTRLLKPIIGRPIGSGGFDRTYVCITSTRGMEDAMRFTREGGTIVLLGNTTTLNGLDWTPLWIKELCIKGSLAYGAHKHGSASESDFATATQLIATRAADVRGLVTHTFPLADYRRAIATALDKRGAGSIKVAFRYR